MDTQIDNPMSCSNIIAKIIVTVVGGLILAYIIQDARFSPDQQPQTSFPVATVVVTKLVTNEPLAPTPTFLPTDTLTPEVPTNTANTATSLIVTRPSNSQEYQSLPNIWELIYMETDPTSPATLVYNASVNADDIYGWGAVWCGVNSQTLEDILQPLSMNLLINGRTLTNDEVIEFVENRGSWRCYRWGTKLSNWQPGSIVKLELNYSLSDTIHDGDHYTYRGEYHLKINVQVH